VAIACGQLLRLERRERAATASSLRQHELAALQYADEERVLDDADVLLGREL
jgi:hypothetical protein